LPWQASLDSSVPPGGYYRRRALCGLVPSRTQQLSLKNKRTELIGSLKGFYSDHFRWLLTEAVQDLAHLDRKLELLDQQLAKRLLPYTDLIRRLCTVPGVDFTTAAVIVAEIGFDMSRFPDAAHGMTFLTMT
jgi:transposase